MQTVGSEIDGGFAQYCVTLAEEAYPVNCNWSDIELASIPISYSTAGECYVVPILKMKRFGTDAIGWNIYPTVNSRCSIG